MTELVKDVVKDFMYQYLRDNYISTNITYGNLHEDKIILLLNEYKPNYEIRNEIQKSTFYKLIEAIWITNNEDGLGCDYSQYCYKMVIDSFANSVISIDNFIERLNNYVMNGLYFIVDDFEREEIDAKSVLYRVCSKAIWNPHCELGKKMIMVRLNKDGISDIINNPVNTTQRNGLSGPTVEAPQVSSYAVEMLVYGFKYLYNDEEKQECIKTLQDSINE